MDPVNAHNIEQLLAAIEHGDIAALDEQSLAQLEHALARDPELLDRIADRVPAPDAGLAHGLAAWNAAAAPDAAAWDRMWERIAAAEAPAKAEDARQAHRPTILRLWQPFMAAAACLLLVIAWRFGGPIDAPAHAGYWPVELATDAEIEEVEVFDGDSAFIVATGESEAVQVIWVLPHES